jgi:hypothetical protein
MEHGDKNYIKRDRIAAIFIPGLLQIENNQKEKEEYLDNTQFMKNPINTSKVKNRKLRENNDYIFTYKREDNLNANSC